MKLEVPKYPPLPQYDETTGANQFRWIASQAPKARTTRMHALADNLQVRRIMERLDREALRG